MGEVPAQVTAAMKQLELSVPQAMALVQELKIVNLQLKVANNALIGEISKTFEDFSARIENIEQKLFGEVQGDSADIKGVSTEAMTLPTEQAQKDAELLKQIQEAQEEPKEEEQEGATSLPLGGPVGEPEEEEESAEEPQGSSPPTSMFPKAN